MTSGLSAVISWVLPVIVTKREENNFEKGDVGTFGLGWMSTVALEGGSPRDRSNKNWAGVYDPVFLLPAVFPEITENNQTKIKKLHKRVLLITLPSYYIKCNIWFFIDSFLS